MGTTEQNALATADGTGLSTAEAKRLLVEVGPNELRRERAKPAWTILAGQFGNPLSWLLLGASVISAFLGETADAIAIGAILVLNALATQRLFQLGAVSLADWALSVLLGLTRVTLIELGKVVRRLGGRAATLVPQGAR